jgi:hypothetical protein
MPAGVIEFLFIVVNTSTSPGTFDPFKHINESWNL